MYWVGEFKRVRGFSWNYLPPAIERGIKIDKFLFLFLAQERKA